MAISFMQGKLSRLPTATELARIRHTIDNLRTNENLLQERLKKIGISTECEALQKENLRHAIEIAAGWEQFGRMVGELPNSYIDKLFLSGEVERGLRRSSLLIEMAWGRIEIQR